MTQVDSNRLENVKLNSDGSIQCRCPACALEGKDGKGNHLRIYKNGAYNCVLDQSKEHNKIIHNYLLERSDITDVNYEYIDEKKALAIEKVYPEDIVKKLIKDHSYWEGRGVPSKFLEIYSSGISAAEEKNKLSNRYIFPIRNTNKQIIGFAGRLMYNNSIAPKWKILGAKRNFIFPLNDITSSSLRDTKTVILVEGIGCVLALAMNNIHNTMCLFGLNISSKQISYLISKNIENIVIATNNEESGIGNEAAQKLKDKLTNFFNINNIIIHLPYKKDFLEMDMNEINLWSNNLHNIIDGKQSEI